MKHKKYFQNINRFFIIGMIFIFFALIIVIRLFDLQINKGSMYQEILERQHFGEIKIQAKRGNIKLNDGEYSVATNITLYLMYVDPFIIENEKEIANALTPYVYRHLCQEHTKCVENVFAYIKEKLPEDRNTTIDSATLQTKINNYITNLISQKEVNKIILKKFYRQDEETEKIKKDFANLNLDGLYITKDEIYINPQEIKNIDETHKKISQYVNISKDRLNQRYIRYTPIINKLPKDIRDEIINLKLKGVVFLEENYRVYPENNLLSQVIGFVDKDGTGRYGIEEQFDHILKGKEGQIISETDPFGKQITIRNSVIRPPEDGKDIILTIDRIVQYNTENILKQDVENFRARAGSAIIMDPFTGNIIAMASYPDFNPNRYWEITETQEVFYKPDDKYTTTVREVQEDNRTKHIVYKNNIGIEAYLNRNISVTYEPGSVFKPIVMAIAFSAGEVTPNTHYYDKGELEIDEFVISNVSERCLGYNDMSHVIQYSCNIGMAFVAKQMGKSLLYQYLKNFGFGERTDIELPAEEKGVVRHFREWANSTLANVSYGQGMSVTPLQLAIGFSAIANGGLLIKPNIVSYIEDEKGNKEIREPEIIQRVLDPESAYLMSNIMVKAIDNGVAPLAQLDNYRFAGKTGTAQIARRDGRGFETGEGSTMATFGGFFPQTNPRFVIIVKIERPRSSQWASETSAVTAKQIAEMLANYYNIPYDK